MGSEVDIKLRDLEIFTSNFLGFDGTDGIGKNQRKNQDIRDQYQPSKASMEALMCLPSQGWVLWFVASMLKSNRNCTLPQDFGSTKYG
jgi:hypothetical protein